MKRIIRIMLIAVMLLCSLTAAGYAPSQIDASLPSGVKAVSYSYSKIRISWDFMEEADGYIVYRASSKNGKYKRCYTTDKPEKNWYINTNRKTGQVWWYKVRAYRIDDGKKVLSKYSKPVSAYARPGKVKVLDIESTGFIYRYLDLKWQKVSGVSGYQVYMRERDAEKFTFMGNFRDSAASIEIPDTTKAYDLKVRAYRTVDGKKVYGKFSAVISYIFDWSEEELVEAGEEYIMEQWPEATFDAVLSSGEAKTPYNGTSWLAVWPKRFCRYEPWEKVKAELLEAIEADMKMQGKVPQEVCFYAAPDTDENWVTIYLLN